MEFGEAKMATICGSEYPREWSRRAGRKEGDREGVREGAAMGPPEILAQC